MVPVGEPKVRAAAFQGRVLYGGKPLAGALVVALLRSDPSVRLTVRSDDHGAFSFMLSRAGVWLVKSVHMVKASMFSDADWDSLWAALTFQAPVADQPPPDAKSPPLHRLSP